MKGSYIVGFTERVSLEKNNDMVTLVNSYLQLLGSGQSAIDHIIRKLKVVEDPATEAKIIENGT